MKLRWLKLVRVYRHWDDNQKEHYEIKHSDEPVLQYFDENDQQWIDVPTIQKDEIQ